MKSYSQEVDAYKRHPTNLVACRRLNGGPTRLDRPRSECERVKPRGNVSPSFKFTQLGVTYHSLITSVGSDKLLMSILTTTDNESLRKRTTDAIVTGLTPRRYTFCSIEEQKVLITYRRTLRILRRN